MDDIAYLENHDFDSKGKLLISSKRPVFVFVYASWCPYSMETIKTFQEFSKANEGVVLCAAIQVDGERYSERLLGKRIKKIMPGIRGYPEFVLYRDGLYSQDLKNPVEIKDRNIDSIYNIFKSLNK
jgi:thiol-disulfide isomerase/thioredoxin